VSIATAPSNIPPAPAKPSRWPLLLIIILLLALAGVGAGWYLSTRQGDAPVAVAAPKPLLPAPALYFALEPAFVVNLKSEEFEGPHYLQAEVQLMTRDARVHAALAEHAPALRARLVLLFSQQTLADIAELEGKEKLQQQALAEVRDLIQDETGSEAIEALLFTSFVTQ